ncbi:hypothetical protein ASO20_02970 [Mycoplasma sp. (ex Biomphalaria glabrata)]|uniref:M24 family metallopeptidase n=1 Tax=Mycoplasma sp. (ex Biomphalaria glabrata) TaxID=1749074 RepID=UPI00073A8B85|nr:aminopeptidase P family protein [Mycoplasma sp. (ex Biomphalaria glabrata)]ALV23595.1 hypothetical protein ASO20_02970 [Mycoplasma sp. (ex Biomphalaria glabrata)]
MKLQIIRNYLSENNIDALLISSSISRYWLTNLSTSAGYVFVTATDSYYICDSRYGLYLKENNKVVDHIIIIERSTKAYLEEINKLVEQWNIKSIAFEGEYLIFNEYDVFEKGLNNVNLVSVNSSNFRIIKDDYEIKNIGDGAKVLASAYEHIKNFIQIGMTEIQVRNELEKFIQEITYEELSFKSIVAFGPNSAKPHASPSNNKLKENDIILIDFGCKIKGYCCDMTRVFFINEPNPKLVEIFNIVLEANKLGISIANKGTRACDVYQHVFDFIASKGYGDNFTHGLGHGLGVEIHENPRFTSADPTFLDNKMVGTIEPGIYLEGIGGVRIEDDIVINNCNAIVLTSDASKELTILKKEI